MYLRQTYLQYGSRLKLNIYGQILSNLLKNQGYEIIKIQKNDKFTEQSNNDILKIFTESGKMPKITC